MKPTKGNRMTEWEKIDELTDRMKVPNGWLVWAVHHTHWSTPMSIALVFVPDENHEWELEKGKTND